MFWEDVVKAFKAYDTINVAPANLKKYKKEEVIDEERSVRWNREEVERRNAQYDAERRVLTEKRRQLYADAVEQVYAYIAEQLNLSGENTHEKAEEVWEFVKNNVHSGNYDIRGEYLDEVINLIKTVTRKD